MKQCYSLNGWFKQPFLNHLRSQKDDPVIYRGCFELLTEEEMSGVMFDGYFSKIEGKIYQNSFLFDRKYPDKEEITHSFRFRKSPGGIWIGRYAVKGKFKYPALAFVNLSAAVSSRRWQEKWKMENTSRPP